MRLVTSDGRIATMELGYAFPSSELKRHCSYLRVGPEGSAAIWTDGRATFTAADGSTQTALFDVDSDPLYGVFVDRVAATLDHRFEGLPQIGDLEDSMAVIWEAYEHARQEGAHGCS